MLALEDPLPVDVDLPLALGLSRIRCAGRGCGGELRLGFGLVKVPPQGSPQHHCDLACRACWGTKLLTARIANAADEEVVIPQTWSLEAVDVLLLLRAQNRYRVVAKLGVVGVELRVRGCRG